MADSRSDSVRDVLATFSRGDREAIVEQLADDVVWHVGGEHPLSGDYRGKQAVGNYHRRVAEATAGTLRLDPIDVLAGDRHLGIFVHATAEVDGRVLDATLVEAVRLDDDGKWAEFWALAADQEAVDSFWKGIIQ